MGCWFCDRLRLKGFAWRGIYITVEKAVMWLISGNLAIWTVRVWEEILYWCFWVLWEINSRFCSKTQWQMFLLVFRPPCWCTTRWAPAWRLHTNLYKFGQKVSPHIFHKKNYCNLNFGESIYILPSFLRFWTLSIEWFWFWFLSILNGVTLKTSNSMIVKLQISNYYFTGRLNTKLSVMVTVWNSI